METAPHLGQWQNELFDAGNSFEVSLVGLAGRLKLPGDWSIRGARLPNHLFYRVMEGAFEVQRDGVSRRLDAGELLWAGPGVPLHFRHLQADLVVLRFRLDARRENGDIIQAPHDLQVFSLAAGAGFLLERLMEAANAPAAGRDQTKTRTRAYLLALSFELERAALADAPRGVLTPAQCAAVRACLVGAGQNWPSPDELARVAQLSPPYFTRLFTRTFGRSPRRFLLEERMRLASVRLLESSASVSQIARELGYADVFAFSRQFKAVQGQNPTAYRAAHALDLLR